MGLVFALIAVSILLIMIGVIISMSAVTIVGTVLLVVTFIFTAIRQRTG
ncbi:MAG: hypothetical protein ACRDTC_27180 [Pseudonocardiaceae bacterium]